jgi:hypothetical protein
MALSDQLSDLAARAKQLEDNAAASKQKGRAELEADVNSARESAKAKAEELQKSAAENKGQISAWWDSVQRSWHEHVAEIRKKVEDRRSTHDLKAAQRAAERADKDAAFAIDFATAAIEEAEYAVLDAQLAHLEVDEKEKG